MAVSWGPARESGTNGARVGIELAVSGSGSTRTVVFEIWLWTKRASYGSGASYSYSGTYQGSGSGTFSYNHTNNSRDWPTQNQTRIARWSKTWTLQYGQTIKITAGASVSGLGGNIPTPVSHSRSVTLPARSYSAPAAPTGATVTRSSDSAQVIKWTNQGTTAAPVTRTRIRRRNYDGNPRGSFTAFTDRGTSTGTSFTDSTVGNWLYEYAIRAEGPGGNSAWVYLPAINTTPGSPKNVRVTPRADGNLITWEPGHRWITGVTMEVQRQEGSGSWTNLAFGLHAEDTSALHPTPNPSVTHRYRVRARASSPVLYSDWAYSGNVELAAPPAAPTNLGPVTPWDATEPRVLTWKHSPVDGSEQTSFMIRYRVAGGSWTTVPRVYSSESQWELPAGRAVNGEDFEWQVRTWGVHPDPSPYSAVNIQRPQARPTVSINTPVDGETVDVSEVLLSWGYGQEQGSGQAAYRIHITRDGGQTRTIAGTGAETTRLITGLVDGATYTVQVEVLSTYGLWSTPDSVTVPVVYLSPQAPSIEAAWNAVDGSASLQIEQPPWTEDTAEPAYHQVWRSSDPATASAWRDYQAALESRGERDLAIPRVNLVPNPRGRRTDGTVVVAENLMTDPRASHPGGWDTTGRARPENGGALDFVVDGIRVTYGYGNEDGSVYYVPDRSIPIPSDASRFYVSARVTNVNGYPGLRIRFQFYDGSNNLIQSVDSADLQPSTQGSRLGADAAIPAGTQSVRVHWYGLASPGEQQHFAEFYYGVVGYPSFFDGDTSPDPDLTPEWTGMPGASASRLIAPAPVVPYKNEQAPVYYSETRDAYALTDGAWVLFTNLTSGSDVVSIFAEIVDATEGAEFNNPYGSWEPVQAGDVYRLTRGNITSGQFQARNGTVYARLGFTPGDYSGPYFDGHLENTDDTTYEWEGEPDNSASVATDIAVPRTQGLFEDLWQETRIMIADHVPLDSAITDPIPAIGDGTGNVYQAVTVSVLPSEAAGEVTFLEVRSDTRSICPEPENRNTVDAFYLNGGQGFGLVCRALYEPEVAESLSKPETVLHRFSGRKRPVAFYGDGEEGTLNVSFMTLPNEEHRGATAATFDQWRELVSLPGPHLFRDWLGRRYFVYVEEFSGDRQPGDIMQVSMSLTRVEDEEPEP